MFEYTLIFVGIGIVAISISVIALILLRHKAKKTFVRIKIAPKNGVVIITYAMLFCGQCGKQWSSGRFPMSYTKFSEIDDALKRAGWKKRKVGGLSSEAVWTCRICNADSGKLPDNKTEQLSVS